MSVLNIIIVVLVVVWIGGFFLDVVGDLIHLVLVIAVAIFAFRFFKKVK